MQIFVPLVELGLLNPVQNTFNNKFGGLPWGLDETLWPKCDICGLHKIFIAQMQHTPEIFDLSVPETFAYVFSCLSAQCLGLINNSVLIHRNQLGADFTAAPPGIFVATEALITGWEKFDDGLTPESKRKFADYDAFTEEQLSALFQFPTKFGGFPFWSRDEIVEIDERCEFLFQVESFHRFSTSDRALFSDKVSKFVQAESTRSQDHSSQRLNLDEVSEGSWICDFAPFGISGYTYVFKKRGDESIPEVFSIWLCP